MYAQGHGEQHTCEHCHADQRSTPNVASTGLPVVSRENGPHD